MIKTNTFPHTNNKYYNINGLRALSAIGIALMHYLANINIKPQIGWISEYLIPWFTNFVFLFFMISSFALCCGYYERMKNGEISLNDFYTKRYKRILPFFGLLCILDLITNFSKETFAQTFMNCTLVFNLLPNSSFQVIGVGWFLGLIFLFYMLFPFFVFLIDNKRRAWIAFILSLVINYFCQEYFFTDSFIDFNPSRQNILYSAPFLLAGGICFLYRDTFHFWSLKLNNYLLFICILINILYFITPQSIWTLHQVIPLILVFSLWLIYAIGKDHRWLHNKIIDFLSNISMEIYLSHMVIFRVIEKIHLEKAIPDCNLLFITTCMLGLIITILFSYIIKITISRFIH